jgi:hypothetical protein
MQIFDQFVLTFQNIYFWVEGAYAHPEAELNFRSLALCILPCYGCVLCCLVYGGLYISRYFI